MRESLLKSRRPQPLCSSSPHTLQSCALQPTVSGSRSSRATLSTWQWRFLLSSYVLQPFFDLPVDSLIDSQTRQACFAALRMHRCPRSTVTEAPIQLPLTPPAFETKHDAWPGFSVSETLSFEAGVDSLDGEEGCAAKARDDLVLVS
jgi:hypothetical protein